MASVFVLLEAFNRKEAAALGFFPCATASFPFIRIIRGAVQPKNTQNLDWHGLTTKDAVIRGDEQNRHLVLPFCKPIAFLFCLSIITLWDFKSHIETEVLI